MRRSHLPVLAGLLTVSLFAALPAPAQHLASADDVLVPDTSVEDARDTGFKAHTNHRILLSPAGGLGPKGGMIPDQLRGFYGVANASGGAIAIVDAYHYPTSLNDFNVFAGQFNLPVETSNNALSASNSVFQVVYGSGVQPRSDGGWSQEAALDIEWAHAMAPQAKIYLVEATSSSYTDLLAAVDTASSLPGVSQISMSWGGNEFAGEGGYDSHFTNTNIAYFASSGDKGGVISYPSVSANVIAVGGTSVATDSNGGFTGETGWNGSGGGISAVLAKPGYQSMLSATRRAVPDVSADADPYTGVAVYDSTVYQRYSGWMVFGGTSVSSPCVAAMANAAGIRNMSSAQVLAQIYGNLDNSAHLATTNFRDITSGSAGKNKCQTGWDAVTGVGSPVGAGGF